MGYRIQTRHTTCPGCREEIYMEELVKGECPLCGAAVDEIDTSVESLEFDEGFERSELSWLVLQYFLFKQFQEIGANPLQVYKLLSRVEEDGDHPSESVESYSYNLDADLSRIERLIPKRCTSCRKYFFRSASKKVTGDLVCGGMKVTYLCPDCAGK